METIEAQVCAPDPPPDTQLALLQLNEWRRTAADLRRQHQSFVDPEFPHQLGESATRVLLLLGVPRVDIWW